MEFKIKLNRLDAVNLHTCLKNMTGSPSYQILRTSIKHKIERIWPEILVQGEETPVDTVREITLNTREQRSLAEGFLTLFNRKDSLGAFSINSEQFDLLMQCCRTCKIYNWVNSKIDIDEVSGFNEILDDEISILNNN